MTFPDFSFESKVFEQGFRLIAGLDEVGRGAFAGPVVAGCVVFEDRFFRNAARIDFINDSKKLTAKKREYADKWIRENALSVGIGVTGVAGINKLGVKKAADRAFRVAVKSTRIKPEYLLVDAFYIPYLEGFNKLKQMPIIKGDTKSFTIAAASIVAKVYRDSLMSELSSDSKYVKYLWHKNKGYGTKEHRESILKFGSTPLHRSAFLRTWKSGL